MANFKTKWSENSQGQFYVDDQCIACDACVADAPLFFAMNEIHGHAYVKQQPKNDREIQECLIALEACPVEAIGSNGNS